MSWHDLVTVCVQPWVTSSYQPKYSGVAPLQYASAPICSTVGEE
jgi:hypothetical protein